MASPAAPPMTPRLTLSTSVWATSRAREAPSADLHTRYQQHQTDGRKEHQQRRPHGPDVLVAHPHHVRAMSAVFLRVFHFELLPETIHALDGLLE